MVGTYDTRVEIKNRAACNCGPNNGCAMSRRDDIRFRTRDVITPGIKRNSKIIVATVCGFHSAPTRKRFRSLRSARCTILGDFPIFHASINYGCSVLDLGVGSQIITLSLKTRFSGARDDGRLRLQRWANGSEFRLSSYPPRSLVVLRNARRFTAEIYMFLLEYNQRHKGASLVHHCRVQLCQR